LSERLIVIGGDAAGMSAAAQARRRRSPDELDIVAFERGDYSSYAACGLPYLVAEDIEDPAQLIARTPQEHQANGVDLQMRHDVTAIDLGARVVAARDLDAGTERREPFDQLVIATGATPVRPQLPGVDAHGVHGIQTLTDGILLRDHLDEPQHDHQRAVVVGAGYIGLEMAEAMHQRGLEVTVVEAAPQPMSTLDPDMGALVADAIRKLGIELRTGTNVEGFETDDDDHVRAVVTSDGTLLADVVVLGIGVRPNVELARTAGIAIGDAHGIATDAHMATNADGVWAAGDCVQTRHRLTGKPVLVALGTHANKQGRIAGANATGADEEFPGVIGTAITKICAYEVGRTGLTEREATAAGFDHVSATIESTTRASYYPDTQPITVKAVAERGTGRLLGAQIIGREGAAKRIDVLATAIWAGMTADEVVHLDLGYAPPFSPVWDPTIIAARVVAAKV
jgi:NADPH-dependent 2,4-dienoyl-CoA reductase/sulfur reductase-like enzyme